MYYRQRLKVSIIVMRRAILGVERTYLMTYDNLVWLCRSLVNDVTTLTTKAVILARGLGTRMRADNGAGLTADQERFADVGIKALIPVAGGKTLLEMIVENLESAGFCEICLVIGPEHGAIRDFCHKRGLEIEFAVQNEALGTADAVLAALDAVAAIVVADAADLPLHGGLPRLARLAQRALPVTSARRASP